MSTLDTVLADLDAESAWLEGVVAGADLRTPTPAAGWDVGAQVAHLAWTDTAATYAAQAAGGDKAAWDDLVLQAIADPDGFVDRLALEGSSDPDLLERWSRGRARLADALRAVPEGERLPWFGPPMSPTSMATARFMETWAHGVDVAEALGVPVEPTDRIRHVAHIGVRTRDFSFAVHELTPPADPFHVELTAPSGETWAWGPDDAAQRVTGDAHDFCLLVTQRRHRDDTGLVATGADAERWLGIAQCFAGPPGGGRDPRG